MRVRFETGELAEARKDRDKRTVSRESGGAARLGLRRARRGAARGAGEAPGQEASTKQDDPRACFARMRSDRVASEVAVGGELEPMLLVRGVRGGAARRRVQAARS